MPSPRSTHSQPLLNQHTKTRLSFSKGIIGLLALSVLFISTRYSSTSVPSLTVQLADNRMEVGQPVEAVLSWKPVSNQGQIVDLEMELPTSLGVVFVPSSLQVRHGSLENALVLPYSGRKKMEIREVSLSGDSLVLAVKLVLTEGIPAGQAIFPLRYSLVGTEGRVSILPQGNGDSLHVVNPTDFRR